MIYCNPQSLSSGVPAHEDVFRSVKLGSVFETLRAAETLLFSKIKVYPLSNQMVLE